MAIQKIEAFLVVGVGSINFGRLYIQSCDPGTFDSDHLVGQRVVSKVVLDIDVPAFNINNLEIESLENQLAKDRADSQARQDLLLDRISKLKAITHNPEVV